MVKLRESAPEDVPDMVLHRIIAEPMRIRVEVQTDDASRQMWDLGTDISEIH